MRNYLSFVAVGLSILLTQCSNPQPAADKAATTAPAAAGQVHGTLIQVMRGILFPNSNVIFAVQSKNPTDIKAAADPTTASDPLQGPYNGWTAVENAGIALSESANLLTIPGRKCSNGKPVPMDNADWKMFVQGLRDAGKKAYEAGQSKNQDKVLDAADAITTACANCHDKYRDKPGGDADRCI